ncbi:MAG: phosphotransferase [Pseudomonadota bacterium]
MKPHPVTGAFAYPATMDPYLAIARRIEPDVQSVVVRELTGGVSAQVRAVTFASDEHTERTIVVRQHGDAAYKDTSKEAAEQQHALQQALWRLDWPVPEPLWVDTSCSILATPYTVMAFVPGATEYADERLPDVIDVMVQRLRALHALDVAQLPALPVRDDPRPEIFEFWMSGVDWQPLRDWLERLDDTCYSGRACLQHGDFWSGNLLWRDGALVAILDWEDAAIGDPVCDVAVARQEMAWKHGFDAMEQLTVGYYDGPIADPRRQALWDLYCGFAGYRYMGDWGLPDGQVAHMRAVTLQLAQRARAVLGVS